MTLYFGQSRVGKHFTDTSPQRAEVILRHLTANMALNRNHTQQGGVLIDNSESVLRDCKNVELSFSDVTQKSDVFKGTKKGSVYLTPYRMVFVSSHMKDKFGSFMFPYYLMKNFSIEQPVFAANYIQGTIKAEAGGGWEGQACFKMSFLSGGAIELGQHLFKLATNASRAPAQGGMGAFGSAGFMNGYPSPAPPPAPPHTFPYGPVPQNPPPQAFPYGPQTPYTPYPYPPAVPVLEREKTLQLNKKILTPGQTVTPLSLRTTHTHTPPPAIPCMYTHTPAVPYVCIYIYIHTHT
uniref:GRAM domain-containing protein n=1 Tax=Electrophorus electricus TaxID=8005 RepID=A0A4W4E358_ELEEL